MTWALWISHKTGSWIPCKWLDRQPWLTRTVIVAYVRIVTFSDRIKMNASDHPERSPHILFLNSTLHQKKRKFSPCTNILTLLPDSDTWICVDHPRNEYIRIFVQKYAIWEKETFLDLRNNLRHESAALPANLFVEVLFKWPSNLIFFTIFQFIYFLKWIR